MKQILSEEKSILIAPFFIVLFLLFVPISPSIKSVMLCLSAAAIMFTPQYRKHLLSAYNTPWGWAGIAFFLYVVLASVWSEAPFLMRLSVIDKYSKLIYLPLLAVGFVHPTTRKWAFNAYFAAMLITCSISLLKQYHLITYNAIDPGEVFYNHIVTGYMVALAVYFAGILLFKANINKWQRAYYILMIVFGSYQVFFLNTGRTGYVIYGLLMSLLLVQKLSFKKAVVGIILLSGSIGAAYLLSPVMQDRTASLISDIKFLQKHEENTSLGFRVQFHEYAKNLFAQHPIIGIGTGGFKYRFSQELPIPTWGNELNDPHSQYWLTLVENGLIGIVLFVLFLASLLYMTIQLKESRPILLGMLVSFVMGSFSDSIFCYSTAGTLLIIFSALCFGEIIEKSICIEAIKDKVLSAPNGAELAV